ncbi:MAG: hypothetical protein WC788_04710 [Candidatus Paceibacterota bacterium]
MSKIPDLSLSDCRQRQARPSLKLRRGKQVRNDKQTRSPIDTNKEQVRNHIGNQEAPGTDSNQPSLLE